MTIALAVVNAAVKIAAAIIFFFIVFSFYPSNVKFAAPLLSEQAQVPEPPITALCHPVGQLVRISALVGWLESVQFPPTGIRRRPLHEEQLAGIPGQAFANAAAGIVTAIMKIRICFMLSPIFILFSD